jgi:D-alanyl-D-alanine carboxypeptidase (penicillin-binding protein 5/6)
VVDAHTARILYESGAFNYAYPASVTKLMTLLLTLEAIEQGKVHLTDKVKITPEISAIGGSQIWLDPRETNFTVEDLLYATVVHSACDAAYALAVHVAGSHDAFDELMNKRARDLGMNATIFHSPHGLPPGKGKQPDISTPYDIALLSLEVLHHPEALKYTATSLTYLRDGATMLASRNPLLSRRSGGYPGCDGLKTGYHRIGGYSIAVTARRNGERVIAVILGSADRNTRNREARKLLDRGFEEIKREKSK